jgi:hypothetical protein
LLKERVAMWAELGNPALGERFTLRNGKAYKGRKLPTNSYRRGEMKQCFSNSANLVQGQRRLRYVEGYAMRDSLAYPFHHAWCLNGAGGVVDVTLDRPEECQYFGVEMTATECWAELLKSGYFGVFFPGEMANLNWMYARDPALKVVVEAIKGTRSERVAKWAEENAA